MAYCQNDGIDFANDPNFCPNCGGARYDVTPRQVRNRQWSHTAKTVGAAADVAAPLILFSV